MADQSSDTPNANDPFAAFTGEMGKLAAGYQQTMSQWMNAWGSAAAKPEGSNELPEMPHLDTQKILENQMQLMNDYQALWMSTTQRLVNRGQADEVSADPVVKPEPGDNRFRDAAWSQDPIFDFIKQSYLLNARWMKNVLHDVDGLDDDAARKLDFYGRTIVDALSPTNFPMTNPVVLRETAETNG